MKKFFAVLLLLVLAFSPVCFAGNVDVEDESVYQGRARSLNYGNGIAATVAGGTAAVALAPTVSVTTSVVSPMLALTATASTARPASGATKGTIVAINDSNAVANCGAAGTGGTTFAICYSDGTNWKLLNK